MHKEFITKSSSQTKNFGEHIGSNLKGGEVIALVGDLGTGKTTFMQGLSRGLGIHDRILSPTFILMRGYMGKNKINLYHLDLYRLESPADKDLKALGIEEFWTRPENVVVVEWADRAPTSFPKGTTWIYFVDLGEDKRKITVKS